MTIQFKKFIIGLASFGLGIPTMYLFVSMYLSWVGNGNTFGGELIFFVPPVFVGSIFLYYFLLKKLLLH